LESQDLWNLVESWLFYLESYLFDSFLQQLARHLSPSDHGGQRRNQATHLKTRGRIGGSVEEFAHSALFLAYFSTLMVEYASNPGEIERGWVVVGKIIRG
jgi:hypothetical protein